MKLFDTLSVRHKLITLMVAVSFVSLLIASIAFIKTDRMNTQQVVTDNLATMAGIIAANSTAAILFGDAAAAGETLGFLESRDHIQAAAIYNTTGEEFATHTRAGMDVEFPEPDLLHENVLFWNNYIELNLPIVYQGDTIGAVYLRSDITAIHQRLAMFLRIVAVVLLSSLLITIALSTRMSRVITDPLLRLSSIACQITAEKNYSLRVVGREKNELGDLIANFNAMLDEIQARDNALEDHKHMLEERVWQRTRELKVTNLELESAKEQAESVARRMKYHAHHDALTGLPNRTLLNDRISTELAHARRQQGILALLFLDLDRFKLINDSLGHATGDQLLRLISRRLSSCIRDEDTVARLGGDEFMVLLPRISGSADAGRIGRKIIDSLVEPVSCNGHELHITTSIGISVYPYDGRDAETLVKNADISMYRAKELGRNKVVYYTAEMNAGSRKQLALETNLRKAVENNELQLYYQPKVDINRNSIVGVEALLRWEHPGMGYISPLEFIPIAEDCGLINPIGEWVLHTAFTDLGKWHAAGHGHITMAVNLSSSQLVRPGLEAIVEAALAASGTDPTMAELEITENVAMQNIDSAIAALTTLKQMGVRLAMDDFGTGYSSLGYLRRLPVDMVKIDQSFVSGIPESNEDTLIAQAIIAMVRSLNLSLVVEGIENVRQLRFFRQQGCDIVQGYLFSEPVNAAEMLKILDSHSTPGTIKLFK
ncbi:MAG: EAL domain-containing protein [Gammaproteobacteria bacterium]|jgi:diguanylate cyclase (GGDEF)-like protein